jgi:hypothetical protein
MNCGSLFVGVRGGTMDTSHPDIAHGVKRRQGAAKGAEGKPFGAFYRLTSRQSLLLGVD